MALLWSADAPVAAWGASRERHKRPDSLSGALAQTLIICRRMRLPALAFAAACASACAPASSADVGEGPPVAAFDEVLGGQQQVAFTPHDEKNDGPLPAKFSDLVAQQTPVRDQASRGVCSIFATTALMEALYVKAGTPSPDFSEQFLQWSVYNEVKAPLTDGGSNLSYNLVALRDFGIPAESAWRYEPRPWTSSDDWACDDHPAPSRCYTNGDPSSSALRAPRSFLPFGTLVASTAIKAHLVDEGTPVVVALPFFFQAWNHPASTLHTDSDDFAHGYVRFPNDDDQQASASHASAHAVIIVGWDDELALPSLDKKGHTIRQDGHDVMEQGFYIIKNSWGTNGFGRDNPHGDGYGFLSYRYVERFGLSYVTGLPGTADRGSVPYGASPVRALVAGQPGAETMQVPRKGPLFDLRVTARISGATPTKVRMLHGDRAVELTDTAALQQGVLVAGFAGVERSGAWTLEVTVDQPGGKLENWSILIH